MSNINLRNWRKEKRQKKSKQFLELNLFVSLLVIISLILINVIVSALVTKQESVNNYLKEEQAVLNVRLETISDLESKMKEITERMNIINKLQKERTDVTKIFDEIVLLTPKEIKLTSLKRQAGYIQIEGISVSQLTISGYLKNLSTSEKIKNAKLEQVLADQKVDGFERSKFFIRAVEAEVLENEQGEQ